MTVLTRAILAFLAMPAVVGIAIPLTLALGGGAGAGFQPRGIPLLLAGLAGLLVCVRDFLVRGRGTLAPWDPPQRLVTTGLYRYSRNPMYLAVTTMLVGWALGFGLRTLWLYAAAVSAAFVVRVVAFEEPWLARTFGDEWEAYRGRVRRWL
jgi:protein-S-isoprenylcysteine O-methyltransferase Ste14